MNGKNKRQIVFSLIKKENERSLSLNVELGLVCQERLIRFASLSARVLSDKCTQGIQSRNTKINRIGEKGKRRKVKKDKRE